MVWYGVVWYGMVWYGMVWYGMVWYGMVWYGMVWYDMVWYGMVWYGMVWYGFLRNSKLFLAMVWYIHRMRIIPSFCGMVVDLIVTWLRGFSDICITNFGLEL